MVDLRADAHPVGPSLRRAESAGHSPSRARGDAASRSLVTARTRDPRRSVLEWSLRFGMLAQRRSGLICARPIPSQIRPSAMPDRRCAAHLRSSARSRFLPVRPGSRAEGGGAIPGLDGRAAGLGALHAVAGGMTPIRSVAAGAWSTAAAAASSGRPWVAGTAAIGGRAAGRGGAGLGSGGVRPSGRRRRG